MKKEAMSLEEARVYPTLVRPGDEPEKDRVGWRRKLVKTGLTMAEEKADNPRINPTAVISLAFAFTLAMALIAGAIQYGRLLNQVDSMQQRLERIEQGRLDDNQAWRDQFDALLREMDKSPLPKPERKKK